MLVGSDPATAPRYFYVYNPHGDVVALTDASGAQVASYSYDTFGAVTSSSEAFANGWSNLYRYDGADRVRYDSETALYWMSVRAYDPSLGRFLARDPLGRSPLFGAASQPYVYGGNNPLRNIDPSGQRFQHLDPIDQASLTDASSNPKSNIVAKSGCDPTYDTTEACEQWANQANQARKLKLMKGEDADAYWRVLASVGLEVIALGVTIATNNRVQGVVEVALDLLTLLGSNFLPSLGHWLVDTGRGTAAAYSTLATVAAYIIQAISTVQMLYAVYKSASWVMQTLLNASLLSIKAIGGGVPSIVESLAISLLGSWVSNEVNGLGLALQAQALAMFADEDRQYQMPILDWCNQHGEGVCGQLP